MIQIFASTESLGTVAQNAEPIVFESVEDAEYEFVGGGNAVNAY